MTWYKYKVERSRSRKSFSTWNVKISSYSKTSECSCNQLVYTYLKLKADSLKKSRLFIFSSFYIRHLSFRLQEIHALLVPFADNAIEKKTISMEFMYSHCIWRYSTNYQHFVGVPTTWIPLAISRYPSL